MLYLIISAIIIAFATFGVFIYKCVKSALEEEKYRNEFHREVKRLTDQWDQEDFAKYGDRSNKWVKNY